MDKLGSLLDGALKQIDRITRDSARLRQMLKRLSLVVQSPEGRIHRVRETLIRARQFADRLVDAVQSFPEVSLALSQVETTLEELQERRVNDFALRLDDELSKRGLRLEKHGDVFRASFFAIELDAPHSRVRLWYGPKEELLSEVELSSEKVAREIEEWQRKLGSGLASDAFLERLREAYSRVIRIGTKKLGEPVSIKEVLFELVVLVQDERFRQHPKKEFFRTYTRAHFGIDLLRLRHLGITSSFHLQVATRAFTRRKQDYLWIPDSETSISGTTYSHLYFLEHKI